MKRQDTEGLAMIAHRGRQWLARKSPRQRRIRREMHRQSQLRWWLVYGPPRGGTSYMMRLVKSCSRLVVSDWTLAPLLAPIPRWLEFRSAPARDYIAFDGHRFLRDISSNILENADAGDGHQLDLVYKQAGLRAKEYQALVKLWGPPERAILCLREPAGYIASATKKFVGNTIENLQRLYVDSVISYLEIKGDLFEYTPDLTVSDYLSFLEPLNFEGKRLPPFRYMGEQDPDSASEEMWAAYRKVKDRSSDLT